MSEISSGNTSQREYGQWGRAWVVEMGTFLSCLLIMLFTPLIVLYFYLSAFNYDCSLSAPMIDIIAGNISFRGLWEMLPQFSMASLWIFAIWFGLQLIL